MNGVAKEVGLCNDGCPGYPDAECWVTECSKPVFEGYAIDPVDCTGVWWDPEERKIIEECT